MNIRFLFFLLAILSPVSGLVARAADFIEFVAGAPAKGRGEAKPFGMPADAVRIEGSLYVNLEHIERVYFNAGNFSANIYTRDTIFIVKFGSADTRTIFRAVLSQAKYKAADKTRSEVIKEVASHSGFVPVAYIYELPRDEKMDAPE